MLKYRNQESLHNYDFISSTLKKAAVPANNNDHINNTTRTSNSNHNNSNYNSNSDNSNNSNTNIILITCIGL